MSWAAYVILMLAALSTAYFLWTALSVKSIKGHSVNGLYDILPGLNGQSARAVIYCYSEHCGPCRKMAPKIEQLQTDHPNVFKLDVTQHPTLARGLGIRATPTSLLVEDGKVHKAILGSGAVKTIEIFLTDTPA